MLIARTWHGVVPEKHGNGFADYLQITGVKETLAITGCHKAFVKRVDDIGFSHFFLCTLWTSWDAIYAFAGDTPTIAVCYPEDEKYELISDPIVIHQQVLDDSNPLL